MLGSMRAEDNNSLIGLYWDSNNDPGTGICPNDGQDEREEGGDGAEAQSSHPLCQSYSSIPPGQVHQLGSFSHLRRRVRQGEPKPWSHAHTRRGDRHPRDNPPWIRRRHKRD